MFTAISEVDVFMASYLFTPCVHGGDDVLFLSRLERVLTFMCLCGGTGTDRVNRVLIIFHTVKLYSSHCDELSDAEWGEIYSMQRCRRLVSGSSY